MPISTTPKWTPVNLGPSSMNATHRAPFDHQDVTVDFQGDDYITALHIDGSTRIQEIDDPGSFVSQQSSAHRPSRESLLPSLRSTFPFSAALDQDVAPSPAFTTPRMRSDISPRKKSATPTRELGILGANRHALGNRISKPNEHFHRSVALPIPHSRSNCYLHQRRGSCRWL